MDHTCYALLYFAANASPCNPALQKCASNVGQSIRWTVDSRSAGQFLLLIDACVMTFACALHCGRIERATHAQCVCSCVK